MALITPLSRRLVLRLATPGSICRQCLAQRSTRTQSRVLQALGAPQVAARPSVRLLSTTRRVQAAHSMTEGTNSSAGEPKSNVEEARSQTTSKSKGRPAFTNSKAVAYWLLGSAASVFGIVVFGGLTRLTESGLSITEWKPLTGALPPTTPEDWESEFSKYRSSPEFALLNPHMTLEEFKKIYFMEWFHRVWGRFVGVSFVLPAVYFVARRRVSWPMAANLAGISLLIGFQGFVGWWMVKSGLKDDLFAPGSHPRVSQYRLTAHLATAFVCYSWMFVSGLRVLRNAKLLKNPVQTISQATTLNNPVLNRFRLLAGALAALVFVTTMSGALVAGLDAGLIYNEFPYMGVGLAPPSSELWDKFYSRKEDRSDLYWRNMLENPSTVQLQHRILATTVFCSVFALLAYSRTGARRQLPNEVRKGVMGMVHLTLMQVTLGISTLIYMVPIWLGALHQAGSLAVLTGALLLMHRARAPSRKFIAHLRTLKEVQTATNMSAQSFGVRAQQAAAKAAEAPKIVGKKPL